MPAHGTEVVAPSVVMATICRSELRFCAVPHISGKKMFPSALIREPTTMLCSLAHTRRGGCRAEDRYGESVCSRLCQRAERHVHDSGT